jgi:hypothetical protein
MWGVLSLSVTQSLLKPLNGIERDGVTPCTQKERQLLHESLTANEEPAGEPHELPAALLAQSVSIVRQLFHDLTVDLVAENFLDWKSCHSVIFRAPRHSA